MSWLMTNWSKTGAVSAETVPDPPTKDRPMPPFAFSSW